MAASRLLAAGSDILFPLIGASAIAILIVVPVLVIRYWRKARREAARELSSPKQPGMVDFVFHKYSGFLVFVVQTRIAVALPAVEAEALLRRLVRHNLTWGLFAYGGIFVPILTYFEWRTQTKRIAEARTETSESASRGNAQR